MKYCSSCNQNKDVKEFYKRKKSPDGLANKCKACAYEYGKTYRQNEGYKEKVKEYNRKWLTSPESQDKRKQWHLRYLRNPEVKDRMKYNALRRSFGLSKEQYLNMLEQQKNTCAICGIPIDEFLARVDHCHSSGKVRELLCNSCNTGIGSLKESEEILLSAINYLRKHNG